MIQIALLLGALTAPPPKPVVTWTPARPAQGGFVMFRAVPAKGDSTIEGFTGHFAGEVLHFRRDSTGAFIAFGGVPVETRGNLDLPLAIARTGGTTDSVVLKVPVLASKFGKETLSVDPQFTDQPDSALAARIGREAILIRAAWIKTHQTPRLWTEPFARPRPSKITSGFGTGREFNGVVQSRHLGVDFDGSVGSTIRASNAGVIELVGEFYYSGNIVIVNHGGGIATAYLHMSKLLVKEGDTIAKGQLIGLVGSSGRVTGPHLHWIAKYGTISVNPLTLLAVTAPPPRKATRPPTRKPA